MVQDEIGFFSRLVDVVYAKDSRIQGFKDSSVFLNDLIYQSPYNPGPQVKISEFPSHSLTFNSLKFLNKSLDPLNP